MSNKQYLFLIAFEKDKTRQSMAWMSADKISLTSRESRVIWKETFDMLKRLTISLQSLFMI